MVKRHKKPVCSIRPQKAVEKATVKAAIKAEVKANASESGSETKSTEADETTGKKN
ncbi:MAG: hypothetical protein LIO74_10970 [Ruminococcus sp.]|nr:hypothetical protein [Ruminococcus sp.]